MAAIEIAPSLRACFPIPEALMSSSPREKIIDAAMALFSQKGFPAVSTKQIARMAHVNESTLFRIFKNKKGLARIVANEKILSIDTMAEQLNIRKSISESRNICESAKLFSHWIAQRVTPEISRLFITFSIAAPDVLHNSEPAWRRDLIGALNKAQENGDVIDGDTRAMFLSLYAALLGVIALPAINHPSFKSANLMRNIDMVCRIWCRGITTAGRDIASDRLH